MTILQAIAFLLGIPATFCLAGIAWYVLLVQYPLFVRVGRRRFPSYHRGFTLLAGLIIAPLMIVELVAWTVLFVLSFSHGGFYWHIAAMACLAVIWIVTIRFHRPMHRLLGRGFDPPVFRKMLCSQWVKAICWGFRAAIGLILLASMMRMHLV